MLSTSNDQPQPSHTANETSPATSTGETFSRVAEEGGVEPSRRTQDPAEEKEELRRDADAGAGS